MQIYYFSRTGRSKKIAEDLAVRFAAWAEQLNDDLDWSGPSGYLKGIYAAMRKEAVPTRYQKPEEGHKLF